MTAKTDWSGFPPRAVKAKKPWRRALGPTTNAEVVVLGVSVPTKTSESALCMRNDLLARASHAELSGWAPLEFRMSRREPRPWSRTEGNEKGRRVTTAVPRGVSKKTHVRGARASGFNLTGSGRQITKREDCRQQRRAAAGHSKRPEIGSEQELRICFQEGCRLSPSCSLPGSLEERSPVSCFPERVENELTCRFGQQPWESLLAHFIPSQFRRNSRAISTEFVPPERGGQEGEYAGFIG